MAEKFASTIHYCNALSVRFGDNDVICNFGIELEPGKVESSIPQATVAMTPRVAKILAQNLTGIIAAFESQTGNHINVPSPFNPNDIEMTRADPTKVR